MIQNLAKHLDLALWTIRLPILVHFWAPNSHIILHSSWPCGVPKKGQQDAISLSLSLLLECKVISRYLILVLILIDPCPEVVQFRLVLLSSFLDGVVVLQTPILLYWRLYPSRQQINSDIHYNKRIIKK